MMGVFPGKAIHMQRQAAGRGKALEKFAEQFGIHLPDLVPREIHIPDQERSAGNIHDDTGQRFIHGQEHRAIADDSALVAESLHQGLPQDDSYIFRRMMIIDFEIPHGPDFEIEHPVPPEESQHVIEESDPRIHGNATGPVEAERQGDLRFGGFARNSCSSGNHDARFTGMWRTGKDLACVPAPSRRDPSPHLDPHSAEH